MVTNDNSLVYIENFRLLKSFLDNSEQLSKLRTKVGDDKYAVNGMLIKQIGNIWTVNFLSPERLKPKTWILSDIKTLKEFKGLFGEVLSNKNIFLPYFLKFSNLIDDNIFINAEAKNFLNKVFTEAGGFKEESQVQEFLYKLQKVINLRFVFSLLLSASIILKYNKR